MSAQRVPGFYGKLPIVGDFVSRRLPREFIDPWDQWLQSSMSASREELGPQWLNSYLTSPLWRFALSPGITGNSGWIGVLMPSVDRVGRYFPLTLALSIPPDSDFPALFTGNDDWYAKLESIALTALEDNFDLNGLEILLGQATPPLLIEQATGKIALALPDPGKNALLLEAGHTESVEEALRNLHAELLATFASTQMSLPGQSYWSTLGSEFINPFVLVCSGLPPLHAFSGFMAGNLSDRGWELDKRTLNCRQEVLPESTAEQIAIANNLESATPNLENTSIKSTDHWQSFSRTDIGKRRKCNEDAVLDRPDNGIWVVADGMGGHQAGDVASLMIVEALSELTLSNKLTLSVQQVRHCLNKVNTELRALAETRFNCQIVGSTVVVMLAAGRHAAYLWAGDSRLYQMREHRLRQLTVDHSDSCYDEDNSGAVSSLPLKKNNVITRAVGAHDALLLDCETIEIQAGDVYLLCSDGLDKEVSFEEIENILADNNCVESANALMELALTRNARDNVSVVVVEVVN